MKKDEFKFPDLDAIARNVHGNLLGKTDVPISNFEDAQVKSALCEAGHNLLILLCVP